jgi:uncharacterized protein
VADITLGTVLMLCLAAAMAGWIDAVVGGGGLVLLPALLLGFPQLPPTYALGTNKAVAIVGRQAGKDRHPVRQLMTQVDEA